MPEYRIRIKSNGKAYPERKGWWFWHGYQTKTTYLYTQEEVVDDVAFDTLGEAERFLLTQHNKHQAKDKAAKHVDKIIPWSPDNA